MDKKQPQLILRIGTHAEKDYFEKIINFLDGIIVGSNLIESTPGATATLLLRFAGAKKAKSYYIDPMSYAFGSYVDPTSGNSNDDLNWIKSEQKVEKKVVLAYKRSYKKLAEAYGGVFQKALNENKAIVPSIFNDAIVKSTCESFRSYQTGRIQKVFSSDESYKEFATEIPLPAAIYAPYFYSDPANQAAWWEVNLKLMSEMSKDLTGPEVHAIICVDKNVIGNKEFENWLEKVSISGVKGIWFWFSKFYEEDATLDELKKYRSYVEEISKKNLKVFTLHGGFFSLILSKYGMNGISHGVGYGEQKDVVPIIGRSTPTVRYYLPSLYRRLGVPEIERCFAALKIKSPLDFIDKVCDCAICAGILANTLDDFQQFGEMHYSTSTSKRMAQTPAAAKRCRFHFLLSRIKEKQFLAKTDISEIKNKLSNANLTWGNQPTLKSQSPHLSRWIEALK